MNSGLRGLLSQFFLQLCILEVELIQFKCDGRAGRKAKIKVRRRESDEQNSRELRFTHRGRNSGLCGFLFLHSPPTPAALPTLPSLPLSLSCLSLFNTRVDIHEVGEARIRSATCDNGMTVS